MSTPPADAVRYPLAPAVTWRLLGSGLVLLALVGFALTALVGWAGLPAGVLVVVLAVGVLALLGAAAWLRLRGFVVRLDGEGYEVRLVRGAGTRAARWREVRSVTAEHRRGVPCLVLQLAGDATTTIPVSVLAGDRDQFARDVRARLVEARRG